MREQLRGQEQRVALAVGPGNAQFTSIRQVSLRAAAAAAAVSTSLLQLMLLLQGSSLINN